MVHQIIQHIQHEKSLRRIETCGDKRDVFELPMISPFTLLSDAREVNGFKFQVGPPVGSSAKLRTATGNEKVGRDEDLQGV